MVQGPALASLRGTQAGLGLVVLACKASASSTLRGLAKMSFPPSWSFSTLLLIKGFISQ